MADHSRGLVLHWHCLRGPAHAHFSSSLPPPARDSRLVSVILGETVGGRYIDQLRVERERRTYSNPFSPPCMFDRTSDLLGMNEASCPSVECRPWKLAAHGNLLLTYQKCRQLKTDSDVTFHPQKHSKYTEKPAESWEGEHERLQSRSTGKVEVEDEPVPSGMAGTCRGASGFCIRRVGQPVVHR